LPRKLIGRVGSKPGADATGDKKEMVYVLAGATATAELFGLLVGWLIFKITSRCCPPFRAILHRIYRTGLGPQL
jgi:hypothetical protein